MKDLSIEINKILGDYEGAVKDILDDEMRKSANEGVRKLRAISPRSKSAPKYYKSWRVHVARERILANSYTIHNRIPGLTHLLENGHAIWNKPGARTKAYPHISTVRDQLAISLPQNIAERLRR